MIANEDYKGEWKAKRIENPDYKGPWEHPMIENPEYHDDDTIYAFDDIAFAGFDLWQVKGGTIFDNILITDSVEEANSIAEETWKPLNEAEARFKAEEDAEAELKRKEEEEKREADADAEEDAELDLEDDDDL